MIENEIQQNIQLTPKWKKRAWFFLISQCVTLFGSTIVQMAIIWYVTLKTSSGVWVAAFMVGGCLPQFLISFMGGVWADRYDRKKLIMGADAAIALVTFVLMLSMSFLKNDAVLLGAILFVSILRSLGAGVQTPAVNAVIPQLVPEEYLMKFNGINATIQSVVQFAAPEAAGVLLSVSTLRATLLVDISTAVVGIGILSCIVLPKQLQMEKNQSAWLDMGEGIRYAFSDRTIGKLLLIYGSFIFLCTPAGFLSQLFVSRMYGDTYWYLTAVEIVGFAGMTLGGMLMGTWGGFLNRMKTLLMGVYGFGILAVMMAIAQHFLLYLVCMILYGIAITMVQTASITIIQENAESAKQGRVFGLLGAMYSGFSTLGVLLFGPLADVVPLHWLMAASGLVLIVVVFFIGRKLDIYVQGSSRKTM